MKPPSSAKAKAQQKPRPLTDEQQAIVDERDGVTAQKLERFARDLARGRANARQSKTVGENITAKAKHGKNGWTR